jgi:hypothetical protein
MMFGSIISALSGSPSNEAADGTKLLDIEPVKTILGWFDIPDAGPSA